VFVLIITDTRSWYPRIQNVVTANICCLTALSVTQTGNELDRVWKEVVAAYIKLIWRYLHRQAESNCERHLSELRIVGVPTENLQNAT
jgi:hypothetical protein